MAFTQSLAYYPCTGEEMGGGGGLVGELDRMQCYFPSIAIRQKIMKIDNHFIPIAIISGMVKEEGVVVEIDDRSKG